MVRCDSIKSFRSQEDVGGRNLLKLVLVVKSWMYINNLQIKGLYKVIAFFHSPPFSAIILPYGMVREYYSKPVVFKNQWLMLSTWWVKWELHEYLLFYIWHPRYKYDLGNRYSLYLRWLWGAISMYVLSPDQFIRVCT